MIPIEKKRLEVGHISHRTDGDYKKVGEGEWVKVTEGNKPKEKKLIKRRNYESNTGDEAYDKHSKESLSYIKEENLSALKDYVIDSSEINDMLRGDVNFIKDNDLDKKDIENLKLDIKKMDQAFNEVLVNGKDLPDLFRGGTMDSRSFWGLKQGSTFSDRAFISTSSNKKLAEDYVHVTEHKVPVLFKISKFNSKSKALPISSLAIKEAYKEKEFLLNRGSKFTILDKKYNKEKGYWELNLSV